MQDEKLTRNEGMVLEALRDETGPQTAYQLLDRLRGEGLRAPPQVYRALRSLCERRLVHRLESLNAFVACSHDHDHAGHAAIFMMCERCGRVEERHDHALEEAARRLADDAGFRPTASIVELRGICAACAEEAGEAAARRVEPKDASISTS